MSSASWLRLHEEYDVLEIYFLPNHGTQLRIASEEAGVPVLFDSVLFVTIDDRIPSSWVAQIEPDGALTVGPRRWLAPGFWEDYFNQVPRAIEIYEEEKALIDAEGS